jgi:hypothetical protein
MAQTGHKHVETTLIYAHLLNEPDDNYTVRASQNTQDDTKLIEAGFGYVTERDGIKLYRKRK